MLTKKIKKILLAYNLNTYRLIKNLVLKSLIKNKQNTFYMTTLNNKIKKDITNNICIQTGRQRGKIKFTNFSRHATNKLGKQGLLQNFRIIN